MILKPENSRVLETFRDKRLIQFKIYVSFKRVFEFIKTEDITDDCVKPTMICYLTVTANDNSLQRIFE